MGKSDILVIIPARGGSRGIPNKNIRSFCGLPLIAHTIKQALDLKKSGYINRVVVATDSRAIASVAISHGAEVPWLLPQRLTKPKSPVLDSILYTTDKLNKKEKYYPDYLLILQAVVPLRSKQDIIRCIKKTKDRSIDAVVTVCPTHPLLVRLSVNHRLSFLNIAEFKNTNRQTMLTSFKLNGFTYIIKPNILSTQKTFFPKQTAAVICDPWRAIDIDHPEDWALAESVFKNRKKIENIINAMTAEKNLLLLKTKTSL